MALLGIIPEHLRFTGINIIIDSQQWPQSIFPIDTKSLAHLRKKMVYDSPFLSFHPVENDMKIVYKNAEG